MASKLGWNDLKSGCGFWMIEGHAQSSAKTPKIVHGLNSGCLPSGHTEGLCRLPSPTSPRGGPFLGVGTPPFLGGSRKTGRAI